MASVIKIPVQAWILDLYPASGTPGSGQQLQSLAKGLALPSFWTKEQISKAFQGANKVWARAEIEFSPVTISEAEDVVPVAATPLWHYFVNTRSPKKGIGVSFVYDLPDDEGGWGGGGVAVLAYTKTKGAIGGFEGSILAHELGHCLLGDEHVEDEPSNLMYHNRHPRRVAPDLLDEEQISKARARAATL